MAEGTQTTGSLETPEAEKRALAASSARHIASTPSLSALFPQLPQLLEADAAAATTAVSAEGKTEPPAAAAAALSSLSLSPPEEGGEHPALRAAAERFALGEPEAAAELLRSALLSLDAAEAQRAAAPSAAALRSSLLFSAADASIRIGELDAAASALRHPCHASSASSAQLASLAVATQGKSFGNSFFTQRKWASALAAYEEALTACPSCAPLHANAAAVHSNLGNHAEAALAAERALAIQQGAHKARRRLADALCRLGRPLEAIPHYERLSAAFPSDALIAAALSAARASLQP